MTEDKKHGLVMTAYSAYLMAQCINTEHLQNALSIHEKTVEYFKNYQGENPLEGYNEDTFYKQYLEFGPIITMPRGFKPGVLIDIFGIDFLVILGDDNEIYIQDLIEFRYVKAQKEHV